MRRARERRWHASSAHGSRANPRVSRWLCALLIASLGCRIPNERAPRDAELEADTLRYTLRLTDDLDRADVTVCVPPGPAFQLRPGRDDAGARLLEARLATPQVRGLTTGAGKILVPASTTTRCIAYSVHLRDGGQLSSLVSHTEHGLVTSVNAWLYRPEQRSQTVRARLNMLLPEGVHSYAPYPGAHDGTSYELDAQAFRFDAYVAFGRGERSQLEHAGIHVETVNLDGALPQRVLSAWLTHHLDALAPLAFALRPRLVTVLALPARAEASVFGCVARGGRDSVLVFVPHGSELQTLRDDWVLSHELSHFALPFVERADAWAAEGFATYFQEVLRSRAGQREPRAVAEDLYRTLEGVEAEAGAQPLADESSQMNTTGRYRTVYWGGAAVFFALDVALREHSRGALGLAELVARFREPSRQRDYWTASALLDALDDALGQELLAPLARTAIRRPFPDFRATFAALGIHQEHGQLLFDDEHRALRAQVFGDARATR